MTLFPSSLILGKRLSKEGLRAADRRRLFYRAGNGAPPGRRKGNQLLPGKVRGNKEYLVTSMQEGEKNNLISCYLCLSSIQKKGKGQAPGQDQKGKERRL